jgi:hypothetical protein
MRSPVISAARVLARLATSLAAEINAKRNSNGTDIV